MAIRNEDLLAAFEKIAENMGRIAGNMGRIADALEAQNAPEIETKPADEKRGKWLQTEFMKQFGCVKCSVCETAVIYKDAYCPKCGAKMDL